jgi:hypothetical protein
MKNNKALEIDEVSPSLLELLVEKIADQDSIISEQSAKLEEHEKIINLLCEFMKRKA